MYFLYRLGAWLAYHTHESIGYPAFALLGFIAYALNWRAREIVAANMRMVSGAKADERRIQHFTREAFRNLAWSYYELFHVPALKQEAIRRRMHVEGIEHIAEGAARGKGVLLATLHYGNTEVMLQAPLLFPQWKFIVPVEKIRDERIFKLIRRLRESQGMEMVPVDEPLKLMRRLKQNCVVGIVCDRDVTNSGLVIDFFGAPARLPDGPVRLAMHTGAALLPCYSWREQRGRFQVRILPPLALASTGDAECDVRVNMRSLYQTFEPIIRERPGQWMAFHPLWQVSETLAQQSGSGGRR